MSWSWLAAATVLVALTGCTAGDPAERVAPEPTLGGPSPTTTAPARAMDELEEPIAERLDKQMGDQGLHLESLDCPHWSGEVPASFACEGWFDGVPGRVAVTLHEGRRGTVAFDAELRGGVVATSRLVDDLEERGYVDVDCGSIPAYPSDVGSTITCAVTKNGSRGHVLATITDEQGAVSISEL